MLKHDLDFVYVIVMISFLVPIICIWSMFFLQIKSRSTSFLDVDLDFSWNKNRSLSFLDVDLNFSYLKNGSASSWDADLNFTQLKTDLYLS